MTPGDLLINWVYSNEIRWNGVFNDDGQVRWKKEIPSIGHLEHPVLNRFLILNDLPVSSRLTRFIDDIPFCFLVIEVSNVLWKSKIKPLCNHSKDKNIRQALHQIAKKALETEDAPDIKNNL